MIIMHLNISCRCRPLPAAVEHAKALQEALQGARQAGREQNATGRCEYTKCPFNEDS
jgi:hypothetical protein